MKITYKLDDFKGHSVKKMNLKLKNGENSKSMFQKVNKNGTLNDSDKKLNKVFCLLITMELQYVQWQRQTTMVMRVRRII